jgi:hypothetical protein
MKRNKLYSLLLVPFFVTACGKSTFNRFGDGETITQKSLEQPLSANDVAFLFPLDANDRPVPLVTLQDEPAIPGEGNFQRIVDQTGAQGTFFGDQQSILRDADEWALVSFRYSPCVNFEGTEGPCKEQIRFVYQPMAGDGTGLLDFSLHVTYEYNASDAPQASEITQAFVDLRDEDAQGATDGISLRVHPVLSDEANREAYFNAIFEKIWRPFVLDRNPKAITFMGLGIDANDPNAVNLGEWRFFFGAIDDTGAWNLETLPDGSGQNVEVLGIDGNGLLTSNITSGVEFNILEGQQVEEATAAAILLPQVSNEHNVNCASCHIVDNQILRNRPARIDNTNFVNGGGNLTFDQFNRNLLQNLDNVEGLENYLIDNSLRGGLFTLADGIPQDGPVPPEDEVVTRMFGYMHKQPVVSQRMAFDNGMAVNAVNSIMGADRLSANGASCSDTAAQLEVFSCLFEGGFGTSLDQCLQQSCN